jgi:Zn-finger nucleic acid-binding protein
MTPVDLDVCPKCKVEGDPIQAVNCKPVKWACPECNTKWTEQGIVQDTQEPNRHFILR